MYRVIRAGIAVIIFFAIALTCKLKNNEQPPATQSLNQEVPAQVEHIDAANFKTLVANADSNTVILDVRTQAEYDAGHIPGAVLMDINSRNFKSNIAQLDRNKTYLVYCRTGNRSSMATRIMTTELGFKNVKNMVGGIVEYSRLK